MEESGSTVKTPFTFLSFDGYGLPAEADEEEEYNRKKQGCVIYAGEGKEWMIVIGPCELCGLVSEAFFDLHSTMFVCFRRALGGAI
jgi:hypothetical protein